MLKNEILSFLKGLIAYFGLYISNIKELTNGLSESKIRQQHMVIG